MKKLAVAVVVVVAGLVAWTQLKPRFSTPVPVADQNGPPSDANAASPAASGPDSQSSAAARPGIAVRRSASTAHLPSNAAAAAVPSADRAQALVSKITDAVLTRASFSHADAEALRQQFAELKTQGVLAVPAIREFLAKNQDVGFGAFPELDNTLGFPSLRLALMDVLQATSGPEVVSAATDTLKSTGDPTEIATLASILEKNEPGEHRVEAVKAAADSLSLASSGQLAGQRVTPAFEVLQTYGDTNVIPVLRDQINGKWGQNAAVALSELSDGAGIPALVALVQDPNSGAGGEAALRPLAQVAARYPQAFDALLEQARQGKIPDREWPTVASALAASDYISNGSVLPETHSPATDLHSMLPQRLELIDRLTAAGGLSEVALRVLQQQRGQLMARIAQH